MAPDDAPEEARVSLEGFFKARGNVPNMPSDHEERFHS
jgi:hypothetical protein